MTFQKCINLSSYSCYLNVYDYSALVNMSQIPHLIPIIFQRENGSNFENFPPPLWKEITIHIYCDIFPLSVFP